MWSRAFHIDTAVNTGREIWVGSKTSTVERFFLTQLQIIKYLNVTEALLLFYLPSLSAWRVCTPALVNGKTSFSVCVVL